MVVLKRKRKGTKVFVPGSSCVDGDDDNHWVHSLRRFSPPKMMGRLHHQGQKACYLQVVGVLLATGSENGVAAA